MPFMAFNLFSIYFRSQAKFLWQVVLNLVKSKWIYKNQLNQSLCVISIGERNPVKLDGAVCKKNDTLGIDGIGENLNGKISLQFQTVLTTSYFFHR